MNILKSTLVAVAFTVALPFAPQALAGSANVDVNGDNNRILLHQGISREEMQSVVADAIRQDRELRRQARLERRWFKRQMRAQRRAFRLGW